MKRWQRCGEVQDSDEDEWDEELHILPQERPQKRVKLSPQEATPRPRHEFTQTRDLRTHSDGCQEQQDRHHGHGFRSFDSTHHASEPTQHPLEAAQTLPQPALTQRAFDPGFAVIESIEDHGELLGDPPRSSPPITHPSDLNVAAVSEPMRLASRSVSNVTEILGLRALDTTTSVPDPDLQSRETSPLSEWSDAQLRSAGLDHGLGPVDGQVACRVSKSQSIDVDETEEIDLQSTVPSRLMSRNFRVRNEKQLRPYSLENTAYKIQCQERGLRPVRLADEAVRGNRDHSLASHAFHRPHLQPNDPRSITNSNRYLGEANDKVFSTDSDYETSDTDSIVGSPTLSNAETSLTLESFGPASLVDHAISSPQPHQGEIRGQRLSVPLSPTTSHHALSPEIRISPARARFKLPVGMTPINAPPTPSVSSDLDSGFGKGSDARLDSGHHLSYTVPQQLKQARADASVDHPHSQVSSEVQSEQVTARDRRGLSQQKRRIRGVLPASWLKIDMAAQNAQASSLPDAVRSLSDGSPPPSETRPRGVARPVLTRRSLDHAHPTLISDDDEEDSDDDRSIGPPEAPPLRQLRLHFDPRGLAADVRDIIDIDEMEDDWVDPMLAKTSSDKHTFKRLTKRQPTIEEAFEKPHRSKLSTKHKRTVQRTTTSSQWAREKPPKRKRHTDGHRLAAPKLGILDAPISRTETSLQQPQFVRLAGRQARRLVDRGRHSPTGKLIRLATREDTEEALSTLEQWRNGSLATRPLGPLRVPPNGETLGRNAIHGDITRRLPLTDIDHNRQTRSPERVAQQTGLQRIASVRHFQTANESAHKQKSSLRHQAQSGSVSTSATQQQADRKFDVRLSDPKLCRGAQLESLENDDTRDHRAVQFASRMRHLAKMMVSTKGQDGGLAFVSPTSSRMQMNVLESGGNRPVPNSDQVASPKVPRKPSKARPSRRRKRLPVRIEVEAREYRQPIDPFPPAPAPGLDKAPSGQATCELHGLGQTHSHYTSDFDIPSLSLETHFDQSTFVGSGEFIRSLTLGGRDLNTSAGRMRIHIEDNVYEWAAWTDEVGLQMSQIPQAVASTIESLLYPDNVETTHERTSIVESNIHHILQSTIRYCTHCLYYLDSIDRRSCAEILIGVCEDLNTLSFDQISVADKTSYWKARICEYNVVLAAQANRVASDTIVPSEIRVRALEMLKSTAVRLLRQIVSERLDELRTFYEDNRQASRREEGVRDDHSAVSVLVQLHHVLRLNGFGINFWKVINEAFDQGIERIAEVQTLEKLWCGMFTLLPVLDFDAKGMIHRGRSVSPDAEAWSVLGLSIERVLGVYDTTSLLPGSSINAYIRALLTRCLGLVIQWQWWRCESLLRIWFDFFAKRGLSILHREESQTSPEFLSVLPERPEIIAEASDCSFHIFLKLLVAALLSMREHHVYSDKKIGLIAWRFVPSHARNYRKDVDIQQTDLDSLRNHFDLLCVLYYASPPEHRIRLDLLRDLIDHTTSHRAACRLSVKAWRCLATYQASTTEPLTKLDPFNEWYKDMVRVTVSQYRLARTEAENDFLRITSQGLSNFRREHLEAMVSKNQRHLATTLVDALVGIKEVVSNSASARVARHVVMGCRYWEAFMHLDTSERHIKSVFMEGLEVVATCLKQSTRSPPMHNSLHESEDSQGFGDFSALQDFAATDQAILGEVESSMAEIHFEPVAQFMSNVFGAEIAPDETILTRAVDIWISLCEDLVQCGQRTWIEFLEAYKQSSWYEFRETRQRHKLTPYFLAKVVERSESGDEALRSAVLSAWLSSLVEREATLGYQHALTSALMNHWSAEKLLYNLPFIKDRDSGSYYITLQDLRQRRMSMLSSILSNIRNDFEASRHFHSSRAQELRKFYADMLRKTMQAMKTNYQDVDGRVADVASASNSQEGYVQFVQQIISLLQQYTTPICPIDRFFTDSSAFPLPANDPTYVVGRLRSYDGQLAEVNRRKELVVFVRTVCERAAVDGQQSYLVEQLHAAMSDDVAACNGNAGPTLRQVLLTAVLPAYIERSFSTSCSWILALPILEALAKFVTGLFYQIMYEDLESIRAANEGLESLLWATNRAISVGVQVSNLRTSHTVQRTLTACFELCKATQIVSNYLVRLSHECKGLAIHHSWVCHAGEEIERLFVDEVELSELDPWREQTSISRPWLDTRGYAASEIDKSFNSFWQDADDRYFARWGNTSKEIGVRLDDELAQPERLVQSVRDMIRGYSRICNRGPSRRRVKNRLARRECGAEDLLVV